MCVSGHSGGMERSSVEIMYMHPGIPSGVSGSSARHTISRLVYRVTMVLSLVLPASSI
jgi:hypothetical protein